MGFENDWRSAERCLSLEATNLGEIIDPFFADIGATLLSREIRLNIVRVASELPVEIAAFPFEIVLRLDGAEAEAKLGASFLLDSRSAGLLVRSKFIEHGNGLIETAIRELADSQSRLSTSALKKIKLELPLEATLGPFVPGVSLFPNPPSSRADSLQGRISIFQTAARLAGLGPDGTGAGKSLLSVLKTNQILGCVSVSPPRTDERIRMIFTGLADNASIRRILNETGCPTEICSRIQSAVSCMARNRELSYLGLHLNLDDDGLLPSVGVSYCLDDRDWLKPNNGWAALLDTIERNGSGQMEKMSELRSFNSGSRTFLGKSGQRYALVRGLHHIRMNFDANGICSIYANLFMLVCAVPSKTGAVPD